METWIVLVWRSEAGEAGFRPHMENPFDGIEVLSIHETEEQAEAEVEDMREAHPKWRFSIDAA